MYSSGASLLSCSSRNWKKVKVLGSGSYGIVCLAIPMNLRLSSKLTAIKSSIIQHSKSLQKEERILQHFSNCSESIVHCYGNELSIENGYRLYNLILEYANGGDLFDLIHSHPAGRLPEHDVQNYTRMILKGLHCIHEQGYVHCDLKPENILVFRTQYGTQLKISDFGLAKEPGKEDESMKEYSNEFRFRGTPLYMSPESVAFGEMIEAPLDIWSLGCIVINMMTGKYAWPSKMKMDLVRLLAFSNKEPELPRHMSAKGKDFLRKCFIRDPRKRWTAKMLLNHPFVADQNPYNKMNAMNCSQSQIARFSLQVESGSRCGFA
ncbi:mitogen-activated protein kinase kinase kinase 20-like [Ziziphus jujuba]|uniref:Mitogen-activated protein kinase kinase kinase 20-like n=1 Tax=Ziziphus jujuba TaxID=326968 RepID=A0ABM4AGC1_ZIZJJ|nr:mitogen-activated protein kinase kinase kinase 20-like [Ziziphus jujuba]